MPRTRDLVSYICNVGEASDESNMFARRARCACALQVAKTRQQLSGGKTISMVKIFRDIIANEGPANLYRGIASPILAEAPKRAIKFSANAVSLVVPVTKRDRRHSRCRTGAEPRPNRGGTPHGTET